MDSGKKAVKYLKKILGEPDFNQNQIYMSTFSFFLPE